MNSRYIVTLLGALAFALGTGSAQQTSPTLRQRPSETVNIGNSISMNELPTGTALHVKLDEELSSETARLKQLFTAHLIDPVVVNGTTLIPAGVTFKGRVSDVTNSGPRFRGKNTLTLRPETIILADGRQIDINGELIDTYDRKFLKVDEEGAISHGAGHYGRMAAIGSGVGGVAGFVVGGPVGAVAGSGIGAAVPAGRWATKNDPVVLDAGTSYWFQITRPARLNSEQAAVQTSKQGGN